MMTFSKQHFEPIPNSSELSSTRTSRVESPLAPRVDRHDREALAPNPPQLACKNDSGTVLEIWV
jgi:hypothetical protein